MSADVYRTPAPKPDHCECGDWPDACEWAHAVEMAFRAANPGLDQWVVSQLRDAERVAAGRKGGV